MFFKEYPKSGLFGGSISSFVWWDNSAQPRERERLDMKMKVLRTNSAQSSVIDTEESRHIYNYFKRTKIQKSLALFL